MFLYNSNCNFRFLQVIRFESASKLQAWKHRLWSSLPLHNPFSILNISLYPPTREDSQNEDCYNAYNSVTPNIRISSKIKHKIWSDSLAMSPKYGLIAYYVNYANNYCYQHYWNHACFEPQLFQYYSSFLPPPPSLRQFPFIPKENPRTNRRLCFRGFGVSHSV